MPAAQGSTQTGLFTSIAGVHKVCVGRSTRSFPYDCVSGVASCRVLTLFVIWFHLACCVLVVNFYVLTLLMTIIGDGTLTN